MGNSGIGVPLPELAAYCREAAAEGAVLLKNEGHMLPVKKDETVSIFGRSQIEYYRSGTGSGGAVNVPYVKNILDGIKENNAFPVNEELVETYQEWLKEHPFDNGGGGWAAEPWHQEEMEITEEIACRAAEKSKKAVFLIGRTAGEDKDYEDTEGSYLLTKREKENLRVVTKYFNEVAVLLNVSNIIDMSWTKDAAYQDHIKAILYIWQGGMEGANAVADLLSGRVTPSGKLTDTIAEKLSDYPAADHFGSKTENIYAEDIYVGYRYFETFAPEKVMYEFGFGLSYTEFSMETVKAESTGNGKDAKIALSIRVKNTGEAAGKEAAQVYVSAPQGQLGKPTKVLCGFAKTKLLAPGEEEVLELTIPVSRFASYDDSGVTGHKSCYVLEEGLYKIYVGETASDAQKKPMWTEKAVMGFLPVSSQRSWRRRLHRQKNFCVLRQADKRRTGCLPVHMKKHHSRWLIWQSGSKAVCQKNCHRPEIKELPYRRLQRISKMAAVWKKNWTHL